MSRAVAYFEDAWNVNDALGGVNLAACLEHGLGVPANAERAFRLYNEINEREISPYACWYLADMFEQGRPPCERFSLFSNASPPGSLSFLPRRRCFSSDLDILIRSRYGIVTLN